MTLDELKTTLLAMGVQHPEVKLQLRAVMDTLSTGVFDPSRIARTRRVAAIPKKYEHLDFTPPKDVQEAAGQGLELRQEQEGDKAGLTNEEASDQGIGSGVQRAVNLKNGTKLEPDTIRQMDRFFKRFASLIEKARRLTKKEEILKSNMHISDLLWGGAPGEKWVTKMIREMDKADEAEKKKESALARRVASVYLMARGVAQGH